MADRAIANRLAARRPFGQLVFRWRTEGRGSASSCSRRIRSLHPRRRGETGAVTRHYQNPPLVFSPLIPRAFIRRSFRFTASGSDLYAARPALCDARLVSVSPALPIAAIRTLPSTAVCRHYMYEERERTDAIRRAMNNPRKIHE